MEQVKKVCRLPPAACQTDSTRADLPPESDQLEYLVADALQHGCDTLVSIGGIQSSASLLRVSLARPHLLKPFVSLADHTRAVTAVAVANGLKAVTVQEAWVPLDGYPGTIAFTEHEKAVYGSVGNIQVGRLH